MKKKTKKKITKRKTMKRRKKKISPVRTRNKKIKSRAISKKLKKEIKRNKKIVKKIERGIKKEKKRVHKKIKKELKEKRKNKHKKKNTKNDIRLDEKEIKRIRKRKNIQKKTITKKLILVNLIISFFISLLLYFFSKTITSAIISFFSIFLALTILYYFKNKLKRIQEVKKMENVFPDFLQLMSSNLRAGMTSDQSLLLSARKEFAPLDKEITKVGKDLLTGRKIENSLMDMSERIESEKISKTINLIVSGINSGGNMAVLLEKTSISMKERYFVEKRARSNILMYIIFIFFAAGIGAPVLFSLSSVLVDVLTSILSTLPEIESTTLSLPFTLTTINISTTFVLYYALIFLIITDIIGSLVIGLVTKGDEKQGTKYIIPLTLSSVVVFFVVRILLKGYFSGIIG